MACAAVVVDNMATTASLRGRPTKANENGATYAIFIT